MSGGHINRRGFYLSCSTVMLSCHINGYGEGSQFAINLGGQHTGSIWYGWWSKKGWAAQRQKPLQVTGVVVI